MQETQVQSLRREDSLEKVMVTQSSILVWKIPWTEEPGGLQSMRSQGVGLNLVTKSPLNHHSYSYLLKLDCNKNLFRFDAQYWMLGAGALGRPRGMVWGGRKEEGSGWGTHAYLWRIHFDIRQNQYNIVKFKNKIKLKKKSTCSDFSCRPQITPKKKKNQYMYRRAILLVLCFISQMEQGIKQHEEKQKEKGNNEGTV